MRLFGKACELIRDSAYTTTYIDVLLELPMSQVMCYQLYKAKDTFKFHTTFVKDTPFFLKM